MRCRVAPTPHCCSMSASSPMSLAIKPSTCKTPIPRLPAWSGRRKWLIHRKDQCALGYESISGRRSSLLRLGNDCPCAMAIKANCGPSICTSAFGFGKALELKPSVGICWSDEKSVSVKSPPAPVRCPGRHALELIGTGAGTTDFIEHSFRDAKNECGLADAR